MKPTHRIYLHQYRKARPEQTNQPTMLFYDINMNAPIELDGISYLPIVRASSGKAWNIFFESAPDSATGGILIEGLGARMHLIHNKWYVQTADINVELAYTINTPSRLTCLQILAMMVILGYSVIFLLPAESPPINVTLSIASILVFILVADHWIHRG